jgi:hypothetical protein
MDLRQAVAVIDRHRIPRKTARKADAATSAPEDSALDRSRRIAEAAYFIAERRGFAPGAELDDWLQAESEISASR